MREKCILLLTRIGSSTAVTNDGTVGTPMIPLGASKPQGGPKAGGKSNRRGSGRQNSKGKGSGSPPKGKGRAQGKGKGSGKPKAPLRDRSHEVCENYNHGRCTDPCPDGRKHQCNKCHRAGHCTASGQS